MVEYDGIGVKTNMETLARLFDELAVLEKSLQDCIMEKNWPELERILASMNRVSESIEAGEAEWAACVERMKSKCGLPEDASFYEVLSRLDEPLRGECARAYRGMKCSVLLVKSYSGDLTSYVSTATSSLREILDELYPHRRGKMYTRSGGARASRGDALVLNHRM